MLKYQYAVVMTMANIWRKDARVWRLGGTGYGDLRICWQDVAPWEVLCAVIFIESMVDHEFKSRVPDLFRIMLGDYDKRKHRRP